MNVMEPNGDQLRELQAFPLLERLPRHRQLSTVHYQFQLYTTVHQKSPCQAPLIIKGAAESK